MNYPRSLFNGKHLYQSRHGAISLDADILFNFDVKIQMKKKICVISSKKKIFFKKHYSSNGMGAKKKTFKINRKSKKIISGDEFLSGLLKTKSF